MLLKINTVWLCILLIYLIVKYIRFIKSINKKYLREFPSDDSPLMVGYLIDGKINSKDILAEILYMMANKKISYYNDTLHLIDNNLTSYEEELAILIFGINNEQTIPGLKDKLKREYLLSQQYLKNINFHVLVEQKRKDYFNDKIEPKVMLFLCFIVQLIITVFSICNNLFLGIVNIFISLFLFFIICKYNPLTKTGFNMKNEWLSLRRFLNDFSTMNAKEITDIYFFEKYLAYATSFGLTKKVMKKMKFYTQSINEIELDNINNLCSDFRSEIYRQMTVAIRSREKLIPSGDGNSSTQSYSSGGGGFSSGGGGVGSFGGGGGGGFR